MLITDKTPKVNKYVNICIQLTLPRIMYAIFSIVQCSYGFVYVLESVGGEDVRG